MLDPNELKRLREAATPGPWQACHDGDCKCRRIWSTTADVPVAKCIDDDGDMEKVPDVEMKANAQLIVALVNHAAEIEESLRSKWIPVGERLPEDDRNR